MSDASSRSGGDEAEAGAPEAPPAGQPRPGRLRQRWLNLPIRWKTRTVVGGPTIIVLLILAGGLYLASRAGEQRAQIRSTRTLHEQIDTVDDDLRSAQSAMLTYIATGDRTLLPRYDRLRERVLSDTRAMTSSEIEEVLGVGAATAAARSVEQAIDALDRAGEAPDDPGTVSRVSLSSDAAASRVNAVENALDDLLFDLRAEQDALARRFVALLTTGVVVALVLGGASALLMTRDVLHRIERLARGLGRLEAAEPWPRGIPADDEIGQLDACLAMTSATLRQQREELTTTRDEALAATRAKSEFLSRMSHELRTPLTAIIGFGQLLQEEDLDPDNMDSANRIVSSGQHMLELVNELLDLARIESGRLGMSLEPVEVAPVIGEATDLIEPQAHVRDITVEVDCGGRGLYAKGDRIRLKQVLLNLLSNAVKYNREGGHIGVTCQVDGDRVRLSVTDTGHGVAEADLERLFNPFDRLGADDAEIQGTGMGLPVTKGLVEAMGGTIDVTSRVGEGSTFHVDLPRTTTSDETVLAPTGTEPPTGDQAPEPVTSRTILMIDDNPVNVELIQRICRDRSEHLEVGEDGNRGLDLARQLRPSLILLDLHLPDMDGSEVLRTLKEDPATAPIPVVVISAEASHHRQQQVLDLGAIRFLPKPIDIPQLRDVLSTVNGHQASGTAP